MLSGCLFNLNFPLSISVLQKYSNPQICIDTVCQEGATGQFCSWNCPKTNLHQWWAFGNLVSTLNHHSLHQFLWKLNRKVKPTFLWQCCNTHKLTISDLLTGKEYMRR